MSEFCVGQRWISNTEASLGLGVVIGLKDRRVALSFPAVGEERIYAMGQAPLSRIRYKKDDKIRDKDKTAFTILDVEELNGLLFYKVVNEADEEGVLPEVDLDAFVHFSNPGDRLLSGQIDPMKFFSLRQDTLRYQAAYKNSNSVGLLGPRVQLLPHQLYIANQVASRKNPRVLLADEVGLGKTIEAGLVIHHQIQTGAAQRVLILVPDSLLHQWLVEMLRRFNLSFSVLNESIYEALQQEQDNPFEARQLVLAPLSFLVDNPSRQNQALACEWDMLVVDEAHHLQWQEGAPSADYQCVEQLAGIAASVLLLTATPEQLGLESHFARLRLLDPDRYFDLGKFIEEEQSFKSVNVLVDQLQAMVQGDELPSVLKDFLEADEIAVIERKLNDDELFNEGINSAIEALLDRHGTGRVLFRNTRQAVQGFPARHLKTWPLKLDDKTLRIDGSEPLEEILQIEHGFADWLRDDARVKWLIDQLQGELKDKKVLLICGRAETAIALEDYLRLRQGIKSAVFHEGLSLVARDRAAAYFADAEDAAQILVCSEIGSEGRNFQFAQHLVMFDLPLNPDLLEQRIGRLDRIGQQRDIFIHAPYYENTAQAVLLQWFHQGLNAFEATCAIGRKVFDEVETELLAVLGTCPPENLEQLIKTTQDRAAALHKLLQEGRDRLLELNSCRKEVAATVIDDILESENRKGLEDYIDRAADQLGIEVETHDVNSIVLRPSENMRCGLLPFMKDEGATYTYSRDNALSREDLGFLTWEHPTIQASMEHILTGEHGNTALATIKLGPLKPGTLLLETIYTVSTIASRKLGVHRFLPVNPVRFLVNPEGKDLGGILTVEKLEELLKKVPLASAIALVRQAESMVENLIANSEKLAQSQAPLLKAEAMEKMNARYEAEINRLVALGKVNPNIRKDEIETLRVEKNELALVIQEAELAMDALRVIMAV